MTLIRVKRGNLIATGAFKAIGASYLLETPKENSKSTQNFAIANPKPLKI